MHLTPVVCAAALALTGCYTYRPATLETVPVGAEIRGLLSTEARIGLEDRHRLRFDRLDGTLAERNGDSLLVEVRSMSAADGRSLYQRVAVAQTDVLRVDVKRVDKTRTIALVAGVAAVALATVISGFWSQFSGDGDGGSPPEAPPAPDPRTPYH